ncbi:hypothetical protein P775_12970 [Puniceibacterium antarcticum]|uniref:Uncharacterized protein n=1 Tax=Puniceibacterium antarcticum TaxID=1206336 RepID=A0A2G8RDX6_9RHOB|nr:hypothetical protein P775_12970 [Puniceibacterium antarcticum]
MVVLGAINQALVGPMIETRRDLTFGRAIGPQLVGNDPLWHKTMASDQAGQKPLCRLRVSLGLKTFFQNETLLIDSPPEPECPTCTFHDAFVQMPNIAGSRLAPPKISGDFRPKLNRPALDAFVRHVDSTFQQ